MVRDFVDAVSEIMDSPEYEKFSKDHPKYYLAHGFTQLDQNYSQTKEWQIGFYSVRNDNLGVFDTNPAVLLPFEEAFKDGGTIDELKQHMEFIPTSQAIETVKNLLNEKHSHEIPNSFLIIVQMIKGVPTYNITAITMAFSMLITHINALTGEIIKESKSSVLNLSKQ